MTQANRAALLLVVSSVCATLGFTAYELARGSLSNAPAGRVIAALVSIALLLGALVRAARIGRKPGRDSSLPPPRPQVSAEHATPHLGPLGS